MKVVNRPRLAASEAATSSVSDTGVLADPATKLSSDSCAGERVVIWPFGSTAPLSTRSGRPSEFVFYIHRGKVKLSVISERGKEAIVAIRGPDEFCGEGALNRMPLCLATATTMSPCEIIRLETETVERLLHENQEFADYFLAHLLTRTARVEADLVDQLFNSSEMRLARALLLLANYGNDFGLAPIAVKVNHDTLAALIGATRPRVTVFMNKFRKLGLINYNGKLEVHKALLTLF